MLKVYPGEPLTKEVEKGAPGIFRYGGINSFLSV